MIHQTSVLVYIYTMCSREGIQTSGPFHSDVWSLLYMYSWARASDFDRVRSFDLLRLWLFTHMLLLIIVLLFDGFLFISLLWSLVPDRFSIASSIDFVIAIDFKHFSNNDFNGFLCYKINRFPQMISNRFQIQNTFIKPFKAHSKEKSY